MRSKKRITYRDGNSRVPPGIPYLLWWPARYLPQTSSQARLTKYGYPCLSLLAEINSGGSSLTTC